MVEDQQIATLKRRLRWEGVGPLTELSNQTAASLWALLQSAGQWLRTAGYQRPLISLLLAFEIGWVVGHWGPRRAKHYPRQNRCRSGACAAAGHAGPAWAAGRIRHRRG